MARPDEVFGIECEHHYGITTHPMPEDGDVAREVYRLIRGAWHAPREDGGGLSDDDHSWEYAPTEHPDGWSHIVIRKNENSPLFAFKPWWVEDGPGARWFDQKFRVATRSLIEREIADSLQWAERWQADADRQRDTIRGRKARTKYSSLAESSRREAEMIRSRWPQFDGSARTGWQERMHRYRDPQGLAA